MKKTLYALIMGMVLLTSCGGIRTTTRGLENESYLEFVSQTQTYPDGVSVVVDNANPFTAVVYKDKVDRTKGTVYAISTGTHSVKVFYKNEILYHKKIFISSQETKYIQLP